MSAYSSLPVVLQCGSVLSLYLGRGFSHHAPTDTLNPHILYNGCHLECIILDKKETIWLHPEYNYPDSDVVLVVSIICYKMTFYSCKYFL